MKVTFLKQKTFTLATLQMKDDMERNIFTSETFSHLLEMAPSQGKMRLNKNYTSALQKLNFLMAKAI